MCFKIQAAANRGEQRTLVSVSVCECMCIKQYAFPLLRCF